MDARMKMPSLKIPMKGGIPRSNMNKIWSYLFTTADPAMQEGMVAFQEHDNHAVDLPLAGLGMACQLVVLML
eukprot:9697647-Ditylum_brightwellii.AAC.1